MIQYPTWGPSYPVITTAPVANTTAGLFTWKKNGKDLQMLAGWFANYTGQPMYVKLYALSDEDDVNHTAASVTNWDYRIADGEMRPIAAKFNAVSIWFPTGATIQLIEQVSGTNTGTATVSLGGWGVAENPNNLVVGA